MIMQCIDSEVKMVALSKIMVAPSKIIIDVMDSIQARFDSSRIRYRADTITGMTYRICAA